MRVLVYSQQPTASSSVIAMMNTYMQPRGIAVETCGGEDVHKGILNQTDVAGLVIPGIIGDESAYSGQIGEEGMERITNAVAKGRFLMTLCAGTYFICRETVYAPSWGEKRERQPARYLFNATATGPLEDGLSHVWKDQNGRSRLAMAPLTFNGEETALIAYGNGPVITPDDINDPDLEILGRFTKPPGQPVAAFSKRHGRGVIVGLSVLPDIEPLSIGNYYRDGILNHVSHVLNFHEAGRKAFLDHIMAPVLTQIETYRTSEQCPPKIKI